MKISMLPSVNVIYLRIDKKFIPISYHKQKKRKCIEKGVVSFLNLKNFLQDSLLLQPIMMLIMFFCLMLVAVLMQCI